MAFDLPQREAILASIESALHVGFCHGWVGIGSCDKIVPGMLLAALRLDRPFIFIGGGQMLPCEYEGERFGFVRGQEIIAQELNKAQEGTLSVQEYEEKLEEITELLRHLRRRVRRADHRQLHAASDRGPRLLGPGLLTSVGVSAEKIWQAKETGKRIVDLAVKQIKPSRIFTIESMKNAMAVEMAICGGTNSLASPPELRARGRYGVDPR